MTRHAPSSIDSRIADPNDTERAHAPLALLEVATALAESVRKLVPSCTAAVAVEIGPAWQLLAQCGTVDVAGDWRTTYLTAFPPGERSRQGAGYAVSAFPAKNLRALLILLPEPEAGIPSRVDATIRRLVDEGGPLLDEALEAQQHDRAVRRVTLLERARPGVRPSRVTRDVEAAISSLWPRASVRFHDLDTIRDAPGSTRELVQTAYDLDRLVVDDATASGLLAADLSYRVAIPFRSHRGAFLVQPWAGGEHLDIESVAAASAIARTAELLDRQHALTTEIGNLRRDEIESAIAGDDLERPAFAMVPSRAAAVDVFQRVEALRTLKCLADQACHGGLTHSDAVAERAVRIATSMELDHDAVLAVQLAGELHEIGTLLGGEEELCDSAMVGLAGTMIRACGLPEAATIVESMHEQFDGSWIPLGRAGEKIPIGARILAVADDLETALEGRTGDAAIEAAVVRLQVRSGAAFDPRVVQVALRTGEQHRAGRLPLPE